MHTLMISPSEPELTRRAFLFGASAITALALSGLGTTGTARGFATLPGVSDYTATAGRFRRAATGFVRCAANEERLCYNSDGTFRGQYLQGMDTYHSAPWDDVAATHGASDPAFLSGDNGGRIRYAGEHSEADIFGTTGTGVVIRNEITNQFHTANNLSPTNIIVGDLLRAHMIVAIDGATQAGEIHLRMGGAANFFQVYQHDASGIITGMTELWSSRRAGYHDMGIINGKRWWYLWCESVAANTNIAQPGIGFGNIAAQSGKSFHVCELMTQKNPATPPAAVPVCKANATFAADTLSTGFSNVGYICEGLAMARSQLSGGNIIPPFVNIGVPYEPLETCISIIRSVEAADRSGIMHNINERLYNRPWRTPANFNLFYGPSFFPRDWLREGEPASPCVNASVIPVFQAREELRPILGPKQISGTLLSGDFTADGCILLGVGDPRTKYMQQSEILAGSGSTFLLAGDNVSFKNGLAVGGTLHSTRFRRGIQQDDRPDKQVHIGELTLQSQGGSISLKGTRTHAMARTSPGAVANATTYTLDTDDFCATRFWMDQLFFGRGTVTSWTADRMFGALTTAHTDTFINQSERPIRISTDAGATWADLSPSFDPETMPHGFLGEHIGVWNFDTEELDEDAADEEKTLRVRYWEDASITAPAINKLGFQWVASQMDMGTYTRWPERGDVFRIKNGDQWIDVTYQDGQWQSGGYVRFTGSQTGLPMGSGGVISNDFIQMGRTDVTAVTSNTLDGCVMIGPKGGYFLTGTPGLPANGSSLDNFTVTNTVVVTNGSANTFRWDHSRANPARATLSSSLFIEAASPTTFIDGTGFFVSVGGSGANNVLTFGSNVTILSSSAGGSGLQSPTGGTAYVSGGTVRTVPIGRRTNYTDFPAPDPKVPQYLPVEFYNAVEGRAQLPTYEQIWDFDLTEFADSDAGFGARAVIAAAKGNHARWNAVIDDLASHYHREPDHYASIPNSTAVNSVVATGLTATAFHARYGGNGDGFFSIVGGELRVARALTGLDRIFVMRGSNDEMFIVDVRT